ncbi:MAG: HYR domain-containing protein, partial [Phaeodactylibacter sp.]|nr:HYR domain-containing protein [Phaeodactylibacter sp.]
ATDNCPGVVTLENDAPDEYPMGLTVVTWIATDDAGNSSSCTQEVYINDNTAPEFLFCPSNMYVASFDCNDVSVYWDSPFVVDNCGQATLETTHPPGTPFPIGETEVTFTATDENGNASNCTFIVTVIPGSANGADGFTECTPDVTATAVCDEATAVFWNDPIPNSNCYSEMYSDYESGSYFMPGITEVTYTLVNFIGAEYTCSFNVEVLVGPGGGANGFASCPDDVFVDASCQEMVQVFWDEPLLQSSCYYDLFSDFQSGDDFIPGKHTVTYTLIDQTGQEHTCDFKVTVATDLSIYCPRNIEISIPSDQSSFDFFWNGSEAITECESCPPEEDREGGFKYMGTYFGHRYYYFIGDPITWDVASQIAQDSGGYLVSINSEKEAEFINNNINNNQAFFIGLRDMTGNGDYEWADGTPMTFTNWTNNGPADIPGTDIVYLEGNSWTNQADNIPKRRFIVEIPCVEFSLTSGLPNGADFPLGTTSVSYFATDLCGHVCECSFDVTIKHETAAYDFVSGLFSEHYILGFKFVGSNGSKTQNDGGYGDYTNKNIQIPYEFPKFRIKPDRNEDNDQLYWRIWIDFNQDGDFEDANEVVFEKQGPGGFVEVLDLPDDPSLIGMQTRMRIGLAEFTWPEPYGFTYIGEFEDYTCTLVGAEVDGSDPQAPNAFDQLDLFPGSAAMATDLAVFPNPTNSDRIYIQSAQYVGQSATVQVFNQLGQPVSIHPIDEWTADPTVLVLPKELSNGIYVLMIQLQGQQVISKRFVLER